MRVSEIVHDTARKIAAVLAHSRRREFTCGDCDRWERCGLSPNDTCIIKLAHLERYDRRAPSRYILPRW